MPASLKIHPGRIAPSQMDARTWSRFASQVDTDYFKGGQTAYDTGIGFWLGFDDGTPKLSLGNSAGNKVTWDGSTLTIVGTITATTGAIGGWTLAATYLTSGSGANTVRLDSAGTNPAISAGSATPASAPFRVTQAGALFASAATISGSVTSTSGTIGGWTLAATYLESGSGATTVRLDSAGVNPAISIGSATPGSAPFRVTQAGDLTASSAVITGTVTLTNAAQTFTPTWTGFSTDPSGDFSYIDFGAYVILFSSVSAAGDSDDTVMTITNLPVGIRPASARVAATIVQNDAIVENGYANIATDGTVTFFRDAAAAFTAGGTIKNWPPGASLIYPK